MLLLAKIYIMPTQKTTTKTATAQVEVVTRTKTKRRMPKPKVTVLLDTDDLVRAQVGGFVNFLRDNSIVGLAVGFVAGSQAQAIVKALIADFIDPASKLFFGGAKLSDRTFTQHFHGRSVNFRWGDLVATLLNLIFILLVIYFIIKVFKLDKLQKPKS